MASTSAPFTPANASACITIHAPLAKVWDQVSSLDFAFDPRVKRCKVDKEGGSVRVGSTVHVEYKDGTNASFKVR